MMFRMLTVSLIVLVCGSSLVAQTDVNPADVVNKEDPKLKALVEQHLDFIKKYYEPTDDQLGKIRETLTKLIPLEGAYRLRTDLTMMRIRTAITLLPAQATVSTADEQKIAAKFQKQVEKIRSDAPLSYKNVVKFAERSLTKEQVEAGRARLHKAFEPTTGDPSEFEPDHLDGLVLGPVKGAPLPDMPTPAPVSPEEAPETIKRPTPPAKPVEKAPQPATTKKPTQQSRPKTQSPVAKPPIQGPLDPAPPVNQWAAKVGELTTKYQFDSRKQMIAGVILQSYVGKAAAHHEAEGESYEQAETMTDAAKKAETLRKLNEPLDKMYDELCRRIRSLNSVQMSSTEKK